MAAEKLSGRKALVSALDRLSTALEKQVEDTRRNYDPSRLNEFLCGDSKAAGIYGVYPVQHYYDCLRTVGVTTRKDLEGVWSKFYADESVRESVERLLVAEDDWQAFIRSIDTDLQEVEKQLSPSTISTVGSQLPDGLSLVESTSGNGVAVDTLLKQSRYTLFIFRKHYV